MTSLTDSLLVNQYLDTEEKKLKASFLKSILHILMAVSLLVLLLRFVLATPVKITDYALGCMLVVSALLRYLSHKGALVVSLYATVGFIWSLFVILIWNTGGLHDEGIMAFMVIIIISSIVLDKYSTIAISVASALFLGILYFDELNGIIVPEENNLTVMLYSYTAIMITGSLLMLRYQKELKSSVTRVAELIDLRNADNQAFAATEQRYLDIFDTVEDAIFMHDTVTGKILDVNQSACHIFGYSKLEFTNLAIKDLSFEENGFTQARALELMDEAIQTGSSKFVWQSKRRDSTVFWSDIRIKPLKYYNQTYMIAVVRDITESVMQQNAIRDLNDTLEKRVTDRTAQLEQANRELESFVYGVSHDLRSPLRHMTGFHGLLYQNIDHKTDTIENYHNKITSSMSRMSAMIDELLALSKLGRQELKTGPVDLNKLVHHTIEQLRPDHQHRPISWTVKQLPTIDADQGLLQLAFENLLSNAIKYTSKTPNAAIEVGTLPSRTGFVQLYVKDNGVGFDMAYAKKLFGVFQRLHDVNEFEGHGVGLANVSKIIYKHHGKVWANAVPNHGATFYIEMPMKCGEGN